MMLGEIFINIYGLDLIYIGYLIKSMFYPSYIWDPFTLKLEQLLMFPNDEIYQIS